MADILDISSGKMCKELSSATKVKTSDAYSKASVESKMNQYLFLYVTDGNQQETSWQQLEGVHSPSLGESSMLNTGELPNVEEESFLSQILQETVPEKYYLSQTACLGILSRASKRGKNLPAILKQALELQAKM